jgi:hypothetical protein
MRTALTVLIATVLIAGCIGQSAGAPAPFDVIAINEATKECGGYWAGDEFTPYELPSGWEAYYASRFEWKLKTPYGECFQNKENYTFTDCCKQLNLNAVDTTRVPHAADCIPMPEGTVEFPFVGVWINNESEECTNPIWYYPSEGPGGPEIQERCLLDKNWISYRDFEQKSFIETPFGECEFEAGGAEACCEQFGLPFVSGNVGIAKPGIPYPD